MKQVVNGVEIDMSPEEVAELEAIQSVINTPSASEYQAAIQAMIDAAAISKQFNDGVTLASYIGSTVDAWKEQAIVFVAWRDNVWQYVYSELAKVHGGDRPQPTVADFLLELPEIVWP